MNHEIVYERNPTGSYMKIFSNPEENLDDLEDVAEEVKEKLNIVSVHTCDQVLKELELCCE